MWPGHADEPVTYVVERLEGRAAARDTVIGRVPTEGAIDTAGLDLDAGTMAAAVHADGEEWARELPRIEEWFDSSGGTLPSTLRDELWTLRPRLGA